MKNVTRKKFLKLSALTAAGAIFIPRRLLSQECLTTSDILGPYYDPDAPFRTVLAHPDEPGTRLFISGQISGNDCDTPLPETLVEAWHANDNGCYSLFQTCPSGNPDDDEFNLRGKILTNENGEYALETVLPGNYGSRPMHIHFMFTDPEGNALVTQLYFEGDPLIDDDPWAAQAEDRIIPLTETASGLEGEFNIQLDMDTELPMPGDVNGDGLLNITDVVYIVNIILGNVIPTEIELYAADANQDGEINVVDIIHVVNDILGNEAAKFAAPENIQIEYGKGQVRLSSAQAIAGLQFDISGAGQITPVDLPGGWQIHEKNGVVLIFNTDGPGSIKPDILFKYSGNIVIEGVLAAGWNEKFIFTDINPIESKLNIGQPFPNPFNPVLVIPYEIQQDSHLHISVFNIRGVLVSEIFEGQQTSGKHEISWSPVQLPSGLYFVKFTSSQDVFVRQVLYMK